MFEISEHAVLANAGCFSFLIKHTELCSLLCSLDG